MKKETYEYIVKIPEIYAGEVMGRLTILDVAAESVDVKNGTWIITAQSRENILSEFEHWLLELTNGTGTIEDQNDI